MPESKHQTSVQCCLLLTRGIQMSRSLDDCAESIEKQRETLSTCIYANIGMLDVFVQSLFTSSKGLKRKPGG